MEASTAQIIVSCAIFIVVYALIVWDKFDRTVIAVAGAALILLFKFLTQAQAFAAVDFNTIGLLISMMVMVMITKKSGVFEYLAVKTVKIAKGNPVIIIILMSVLTGVISAFLDNVTTILLVLPVTFSVTKDLKINPVPFVIAEVFASNIGGTATLIGDPPNIMIGSAAGFTFMDFLKYNTGVIAVTLVVTTIIFAWIYRKGLNAKPEDKAKVLQMDEKACIKDRNLLVKSLIVLGLTIVGFLLHGTFHYESATVAIIGAVVLLAVTQFQVSTEKILQEVEWKTIFFFVGLFIIVGSLKEAGVISILAQKAIEMTQGNPFATIMAIFWFSAIASAFIDNIPYAATMIPLIQNIGTMTTIPLTPLWIALSLGACLGGNGTIIGASANVVASGMSEEMGYKIKFGYWLKICFPVMIVSAIISAVYLIIFYLR